MGTALRRRSAEQAAADSRWDLGKVCDGMYFALMCVIERKATLG